MALLDSVKEKVAEVRERSPFVDHVVRMVEQRQLARGLAHLAATVVLGVGAAALGYLLATG